MDSMDFEIYKQNLSALMNSHEHGNKSARSLCNIVDGKVSHTIICKWRNGDYGLPLTDDNLRLLAEMLEIEKTPDELNFYFANGRWMPVTVLKAVTEITSQIDLLKQAKTVLLSA